MSQTSIFNLLLELDKTFLILALIFILLIFSTSYLFFSFIYDLRFCKSNSSLLYDVEDLIHQNKWDSALKLCHQVGTIESKNFMQIIKKYKTDSFEKFEHISLKNRIEKLNTKIPLLMKYLSLIYILLGLSVFLALFLNIFFSKESNFQLSNLFPPCLFLLFGVIASFISYTFAFISKLQIERINQYLHDGSEKLFDLLAAKTNNKML